MTNILEFKKKPFKPKSFPKVFPFNFAFDDQSNSFTRGFEFGKVYAILSDFIPENISLTLLSSNKEMLIRLAKKYNYSIEIENSGLEDWILVTFTLNAPPKRTV